VSRERMERILILDEHPVMRMGIRQIICELDKSIEVSESDGKYSMTKLFENYVPDMIIMELEFKDFDGIALSKEILKNYPYSKIIVFTMNSSGYSIRRALDFGIKGYILKKSSYEELITGIKKVEKGRIYLCENALEIYQHYKIRSASDELNILSIREKDILQNIIKGYSLKNIAYQLGLSEKTISVHKHNIMRKLNVKNNSELLMVSTEKGLM
jgi:DNA-binding NarL/FixJ family response regulator